MPDGQDALLSAHRESSADNHISNEVVANDDVVAADLVALERAMSRAAGGAPECARVCQPLLANLSCLAFVKDTAGRYVYLNSAAERALGKAASEWNGRTDAELHPPELAIEYRINDRRVLDSARAVQSLELIHSPEGPRHWLISRFPLELRGGRVMLIGAVGLDVTESVAAPPGACESCSGLLDTLGCGTYCVSADGSLVSANRTFARLLGFRDSRDLLAGAPTQLRPSGEMARVLAQLNGCCCLQNVATRWLTRTGSEIRVREHVRAMRNSSGTIEWLRGVLEPCGIDNTPDPLGHARTELLEMVIRNEPLGDILPHVCSLVESHQPGRRCLILLLRDGRLEPVAGSHPRGQCAQTEFAGVLANITEGCEVVSGGLPAPLGAYSAVPIRSGESLLLGAVLVWQPALSSQSGLSNDDTLMHPAGIDLLNGASRLAALAIEHAQLHDRLIDHSRYDKLTGLPNQWLLENRLEHSLDAARERNARLALLWIDLDRFREINDTLGHRFGDDILIQSASRLSACLPEGATVARIGGDEFAVLLAEPETDPEGCAARICDEFRNSFQTDGYEVFVTASIGIAVYPEDGSDAATLRRNVDRAMYTAKNRGRNSWCRFERSAMLGGAERIEMETSLHHALPRDEFELYYQPQLDSDLRIRGMEALLRWRHPRLGVLIPRDFLKLAEDTGFIIPMGTWVLQQACRQAAVWAASDSGPVRVAVNVSALQFYHADFCDIVEQALASASLDPALLELELTESAMMFNFEEASRQMQRIRALGVSIAIDDFGTGYSSLSYLQRLPANTLKIDRSFLSDLDGKNAVPIVRAITTLARSVGLAVLAEGVETSRQLSAMREVGVDLLQGYFFRPPMSATEARQYLESHRPAAVARRPSARAMPRSLARTKRAR
ncbi:MAG TPA: EAL domain-containing protein [Bryobacteraceae bacterium]|nr:EAL domain-containing protein [Bryobacteraceae bacterium]